MSNKKLTSLVVNVADWLQNGRGYELSIDTLKVTGTAPATTFPQFGAFVLEKI